MKTVDCFGIGFREELKMLEIRLNILDPVVDYFIIVEANKSFVGKDKELPLLESYINNGNKYEERFKRFAPKIIHVVLDNNFPEYKDSWTYERWQRERQMHGLGVLNLNDNDIVLTSDLDEIWNPLEINKIVDVCHNSSEHRTCITQKLYYYYLNCLYPKVIKWNTLHSKASTWKELNRIGGTQELRLIQCENHIENGGWHFSFLGGIEAIKRKIQNFSHEEFNKEEIINDETLLQLIESGKDILQRGNYFGDEFTFKTVPIDNSYPDYIVNNQEKLKHLIRPIENNLIKGLNKI